MFGLNFLGDCFKGFVEVGTDAWITVFSVVFPQYVELWAGVGIYLTCGQRAPPNALRIRS